MGYCWLLPLPCRFGRKRNQSYHRPQLPKQLRPPPRQAHVQPIITATLMACVFIDLPKAKRLAILTVRLPNTAMEFIHSVSIARAHVHAMAEWRGGSGNKPKAKMSRSKRGDNMKTLICIAITGSFILGVAAQPKLITLPTNYLQRVNAINDPRQQADYLARGVLTVQDEVGQLRSQAGPVSANHEQRILALTQQTELLAQHVQAIETEDLQTQIDGIKNDLTDFRNVTCPLIKNAKLKDVEKDQVDKVCQESMPTKSN